MPALELKDVILHPAYNKYILNTTVEYIDHLRNIICVYDKWQRVRNYMTRFKLTTRVSTADDCFAIKSAFGRIPIARQDRIPMYGVTYPVSVTTNTNIEQSLESRRSRV